MNNFKRISQSENFKLVIIKKNGEICLPAVFSLDNWKKGLKIPKG
jgi:hypothetical protein